MTSPFKFLDSYTKEDKDIFFGRDREIEQLYQKVFESKLLLVYGVSGTGKSSLIQCGLANKFQDSDWLPINIRRGGNINESLDKQITQLLLTEVKLTASLKKKINSLYLDHFKPIYLIFDQFEELFIFGSDSEKEEFILTVKKLVESDIQCKFIFAIREEYLANITEFEKEIPSFLENRMRIEKMRPTQAKDCIEGPCKFANIQLEEGVSDKLLENLRNEKNEVELTWLQVYLDKLYRSTSEGNKHFTHELVNQLGKVSDLLGSFLDEQIVQATNPDETLAILKSFVSVKGTKRQITLEEVNSYCQTIGKQIDKNDLKIELQSLVNLRILRDKDENGRYELRHDALASKIFEKITLVEKEIMQVRQFVESAFENYQRRGILLSVSDLDYLDTYKNQLFFDQAIEDFLIKSQKQIERQKRVVNNISKISAGVLILICALVMLFVLNIISKNSANEKAVESLLTNLNSKERFEKAKEAYNEKPNFITAHALMSTYYGSEMDSLSRYFTFSDIVVQAKFSADGKYIYGFSQSNEIFMIDTLDFKVTNIAWEDGNIYQLVMSPKNKFHSLINHRGAIHVINMEGEVIYSDTINLKNRCLEDVMRFSNNDDFIAYIKSDNEIVIKYLQENKKENILSADSLWISSLDISPDNRFIAGALNNGVVKVWYYNKINEHFDLYSNLTIHKDTVWSVDFSNNSKWILTASADSTTKTSMITENGKQSSHSRYFYLMRKNMGKVKRSVFSKTNRFIISDYYSLNIDMKFFKWYLLPVDSSILNLTTLKSALGFKDPGWEVYDLPIYADVLFNDFSSIDFSIDNELVALSYSNTKKTKLYATRAAYKICSFNGRNAIFSPDGKYLLTKSSKQLHLYYLVYRDFYKD